MCLSIHLFEIVHYKLLNSMDSSINISMNDKMETIQLISWIQVLSYIVLWNKKKTDTQEEFQNFSALYFKYVSVCIYVYIYTHTHIYIYIKYTKACMRYLEAAAAAKSLCGNYSIS